MPHLTLEYTDNIKQTINFNALFAQLHEVLAKVGGIPNANCKSRAMRHADYHIADGDTEGAFVHLEIRFLEGRTSERKQEIGQLCLGILEAEFAPSVAKLKLQITVEIRDIERLTYFKTPAGTL